MFKNLRSRETTSLCSAKNLPPNEERTFPSDNTQASVSQPLRMQQIYMQILGPLKNKIIVPKL